MTRRLINLAAYAVIVGCGVVALVITVTLPVRS